MDDIRALLAALESAVNAHDAESVAAVFTAEGRTVTVDGALARGRRELLDAHRAAFAGPAADQRVSYVLANAVELTNDVALAQVNLVPVDVDGAPIDVGHTATALHVLHRCSGRWLVAARQSTLVPGDPEDPAAQSSGVNGSPPSITRP